MDADASKLYVTEIGNKYEEENIKASLKFYIQARRAIEQIRNLKGGYRENKPQKKQEIDRYCDSVSKTLESSISTLHKPDAQDKFINDMIAKSKSDFKHDDWLKGVLQMSFLV